MVFQARRNTLQGQGLVDSLSSIFNSIKASAAPIFKSVGNYVVDN